MQRLFFEEKGQRPIKACLPAGRETILARDNYSYKKYQRELAKKKKKEEKLQRKLDKKNAQLNENSRTTVPGEGATVSPE